MFEQILADDLLDLTAIGYGIVWTLVALSKGHVAGREARD
jgi:hypothetical protein